MVVTAIVGLLSPTRHAFLLILTEGYSQPGYGTVIGSAAIRVQTT